MSAVVIAGHCFSYRSILLIWILSILNGRSVSNYHLFSKSKEGIVKRLSIVGSCNWLSDSLQVQLNELEREEELIRRTCETII